MKHFLIGFLAVILCLCMVGCQVNTLNAVVTSLDLLADACTTAAAFVPVPINLYVAAAATFCSAVAGLIAQGDPNLAADVLQEGASLVTPTLTGLDAKAIAIVQGIASLVQQVIGQVKNLQLGATGSTGASTPAFSRRAVMTIPTVTLAKLQTIKAKADAAAAFAKGKR